jgi:hypothetical protein
MKVKTKAQLLKLNMDLIPMKEKGIPDLSQETITEFIESLNSLQQEKGKPILFCLYSEKNIKKSIQKGIDLYNFLAPLLPISAFSFGAISTPYQLFNPYKEVVDYDMNKIYPEYEIDEYIYMMGDDLISTTKQILTEGIFTIIKGNSLKEIAQNLKTGKKCELQRKEL